MREFVEQVEHELLWLEIRCKRHLVTDVSHGELLMQMAEAIDHARTKIYQLKARFLGMQK